MELFLNLNVKTCLFTYSKCNTKNTPCKIKRVKKKKEVVIGSIFFPTHKHKKNSHKPICKTSFDPQSSSRHCQLTCNSTHISFHCALIVLVQFLEHLLHTHAHVHAPVHKHTYMHAHTLNFLKLFCYF